MESLPLKELDFGLQKRTEPSSGVVASIVLVSPGLDCPGVSLAEVCTTCLRCHLYLLCYILCTERMFTTQCANVYSTTMHY